MSLRAKVQDLAPQSGILPSHSQLARADPSLKPETSTPTGARNKRRASGPATSSLSMAGPSMGGLIPGMGEEPSMTSSPMGPPAKKSRTNTPWTPAEEQRLKNMRDAGNSWADIAKVSWIQKKWKLTSCRDQGLIQEPQTFPSRTEGSVKKHWYKVKLSTLPMGKKIRGNKKVLGYALCRICRR